MALKKLDESCSKGENEEEQIQLLLRKGHATKIKSSWTISARIHFQGKFYTKKKKDGTEPKSFPPSSETSFLLKAIENVVPNYFTMEILEKVPLHLHQHAYRAGRSTDTMHYQLNSIDLHSPEIRSKKLMQCSY